MEDKHLEKRVHEWLDELFGLSGNLNRLLGYDDINFKLDSGSDLKYVVKLTATAVGSEHLLAQNKILEHLKVNSDCPDSFPQAIATKDGRLITKVSDGSINYFIRLLTFLPGTPMAAMPTSNVLYEALGKFLGHLNHCLDTLEIPGIVYEPLCLGFAKRSGLLELQQ